MWLMILITIFVTDITHKVNKKINEKFKACEIWAVNKNKEFNSLNLSR